MGNIEAERVNGQVLLGQRGSGRVSRAPPESFDLDVVPPEPADPGIKAAASWKTT